MKRYIFNGGIENDSVREFVSFVDNNPKDTIRLYLSSPGGIESGMLIMLDVINASPERFELMAIERISSCAFRLFFEARCARYITPGTIGMCHLTGTEMRMMANGKPCYDGDKESLKSDKWRTEHLLKLLKEIGSTKQEINKVLKGDDVYFQYDRMVALLANQSIAKEEMPPYDHSHKWVRPLGTS